MVSQENGTVHTEEREHGARRFALCFCLFWLLGTAVAEGVAQSESEEWLSSHNRYRALHQSPPLQWSDALAEGAGSYAATCPEGHSPSGYGENMAWASYGQRPEEVVGRWYGEEPAYDYERPGFSPGIGHFTQLVWKASAEVGCGCRGDCPGAYRDVCVCWYNPPGNYRNRFAGNVLPPHNE